MITSKYDNLFDQLLAGKKLRVSALQINIASLRTQFYRQQKLWPEAMRGQVIRAEADADPNYLLLYCDSRKIPEQITFEVLDEAVSTDLGDTSRLP